MATLYITEYATLAASSRGSMQIPEEPPIAEQTVAIGAAAQSAVLNAKTQFVRVQPDAICSIQFGTNPIATVTTAARRMVAGQTEYCGVPQTATGSGLRIGVISNV
jgi:hypothetical protein